MSTRANIIIKDQYTKLWFYRHSDGYPEGTMPTLEKFLDWVKSGKIRNNAGQAAGWLIAIGIDEYKTNYKGETKENPLEPGDDGLSGWKIGAYEPTGDQHGDIEYLYTIDLDALTIEQKRV